MRSHKRSLGLSAILTILAAAALLTAVLASAQEAVIHSFNNNGKDAADPVASLIADSVGNLYGTTYKGGTYGYGTVFELSPKTGGGWTGKILHSFNNNNIDGFNPDASLIFDGSGNLYGTTNSGGSYEYGIAFELSPTGSGAWTEKVLHNFGSDTSSDGWFPAAGLVFDASGNLYGTTAAGGTHAGGVVFELTPGAGGDWKETTLHSFLDDAPTDGFFPLSGLTIDASGNLYGTTFQGGTYGVGTVFELTPGTDGTWTESVLFNFGTSEIPEGSPYAGVILDASGNLYGTIYNGGVHNDGAVFELSPGAGGVWTETYLHSFASGGKDGFNPQGGVVFDAAGNLYGTTFNGGAYTYGIAFELTPKVGGGWTEKPLHSFNDNGKDGYNPSAGLIFGLNGKLYGTTGVGGAFGGGTVFEITP
jgi:uncharacterized repeat protein (TIGR03803 family)